jgi:hypothetical protein
MGAAADVPAQGGVLARYHPSIQGVRSTATVSPDGLGTVVSRTTNRLVPERPVCLGWAANVPVRTLRGESTHLLEERRRSARRTVWPQ